MVCRGGPWKVPWYAVEDAAEGFAAGGATACHGMSREKTTMYMPLNIGRATTSMGGPTTSRNRIVVAFALFCDGSLSPSARLPACVHSCERPNSVAFRIDFLFSLFDSVWTPRLFFIEIKMSSIFDFAFRLFLDTPLIQMQIVSLSK